MRNLREALKDHDPHLLEVIANRWDVDLGKDAVENLAVVMLDPARAASEWERLKDNERGAVQMLIAARNNKMPTSQFSRLFGEIRQMGPDKRQREKPHLDPTGPAETLYYRGLLHMGFDESKQGLQSFVYVPLDLAATLPTTQIGIDLTEEPTQLPDMGEEPTLLHITQEEPPASIQRANSTVVDDLTTLLAYIQLHSMPLEHGHVPERQWQEILQHMIDPNAARLEMLMLLAYELGLIVEEGGKLQTERQAVRRWLEAPRTTQVKQLIETWQNSTAYNELFQLPDLQPEGTGWQNNPLLLRQTVQETTQALIGDQWIALEGLIEEIKESEPDFQRPGGDYDSWYIKDRASGTYLQGFESWDRVEGAMLRFTIGTVMHWLGMVDTGMTGAAVDSFKLTTYGKAWVGRSAWPELKDPESYLTLEADGRILMPRAASRYDRFQLARFTTWGPAGDTFTYTLTNASLRRAAEQGIKPEHIFTFLNRTVNHELPPAIHSLLNSWEASAGGTPLLLKRMVVLHVDTEDNMRLLWEKPDIRRFLGQQLGPLVVAVREDQWQGLVKALEQHGIALEVDV
ncbi:MAG: helicase-associated domain-containing protein [Anaerolineales bacterium]|nr:helicase-associated domain-containing protein [Anaerolineales bacterium]